MQLKMYFFPGIDDIPELVVPEGFEIRDFTPNDASQYLALRPMSGFSEWDEAKLQTYLSESARRILLLVDKANGKIAQAASAESFMEEGQGQFGWLMSNPEYRGMGLGRPISIATMQALKDEGFRRCSIFTDEFRVPAVRIYLKLGWHPVYYAEDMEGRWKVVGESLKMNFIPADENGPQLSRTFYYEKSH